MSGGGIMEKNAEFETYREFPCVPGARVAYDVKTDTVVVLERNARLFAFSFGSGRQLFSVPVPNAQRLALMHDCIIAADSEHGRAFVFSLKDGSPITSFGISITYECDIAFDSATNRILLLDAPLSRIFVLDATEFTQKGVVDVGSVGSAFRMLVDDAGQILVMNLRGDITVFSRDLVKVRTFTVGPFGGVTTAFVLDDSGTLWFTSTY